MAVKRACGSAASTPVRGTETRWLLCDDRRERTQPATGGLFVGSRCRASVSMSLNLAAKPVADSRIDRGKRGGSRAWWWEKTERWQPL